MPLFVYLRLICFALNAPEYASGAQYISFIGNISGSVTYSPQYSCPARDLGSYARTYLYVGLNPPWDSNPFFFGLYHLASDTSGFGFTKDAIYNLDFSSAAYECYNGDKPCASFIPYPTYVPQVYLDLTGKGNGTSNITKVRLGDEDGYAIWGANNWIGSSGGDSVNVRAGCDEADVSLTSFTWSVNHSFPSNSDYIRNSSAPISYNLTMTNSISSLSLRTNILRSSELRATMELNFSGSTNFTQNAAIQLDTTDPSVPKFRWTNGSQIYFSNHSGTWVAAATPPVGSTTSSLGSRVPSPTESIASVSVVTTSRSTAGRAKSEAANEVYAFLLAVVGYVMAG